MTTILTVDDSRAVRSIITKSLKSYGFEILDAEDGQQGLEQLEAAMQSQTKAEDI